MIQILVMRSFVRYLGLLVCFIAGSTPLRAQQERFNEILDQYSVLRAMLIEKGSVVTRERYSLSTPESTTEKVEYVRYCWCDGSKMSRVDKKSIQDNGNTYFYHRLKRDRELFRLDFLGAIPLSLGASDIQSPEQTPFVQDFLAFPFNGLFGWEDGTSLTHELFSKMKVISLEEDPVGVVRALILVPGAKAVFDYEFRSIGEFVVPVMFKSRASPDGPNGPPLVASKLDGKSVRKWRSFIVCRFDWVQREELTVPSKFLWWSDQLRSKTDEEFEVVFAGWDVLNPPLESVFDRKRFTAEAVKKINFDIIAQEIDTALERNKK